MVELLTGYVFAHVGYVFLQNRQESLCVSIGYLVLCCALIIATFVDLELFIIPDEVIIAGIPLALIFSVVCPDLHNAHHTLRSFSLLDICRLNSLTASLIGVFIGGGLIFLCGVLGKLLLKRDAMGFGDVKLMGMVGGFVGWKLAVAIFFVAPFFGLFMAVPVLIFKKSHTIPYGPFLSLAALVCILTQDYFLRLINSYIQFFAFLIKGFPC